MNEDDRVFGVTDRYVFVFSKKKKKETITSF